MLAITVLALTLSVAPGDAAPVERAPVEGVLLAHAYRAEGRTFIADVAAARDLLTWVDAMNAPVTVDGVDVRARVAVRTSTPLGRCGVDGLPTCAIMQCESGGSLTARNASGAAGKWQIMPGTWNGFAGYASADQAPEHVQDQRARELWRDGAGAGHWQQCL